MTLRLDVLFLCALAARTTGQSLGPGLSVMIGRKGLNQIEEVAMDIVPKVFQNIEFDDPLDTNLAWGYGKLKIFNLSIRHMDRPTINATFREDEGLYATGHINRGNVTAGFHLLSAEGTMVAELRDFRMYLLMTIIEKFGGEPQIDIKNCSITIGSSNIQSDSWTLRMALSMTGEESLRNYVADKICELFINSVHTDGPIEAGESLFCGDDKSRMSNMGRRVKFPMQAFSINMSLVADPRFHEDYAVMGFNATVLYNDQLSRRSYVAVKPQPHRPTGPKMARIDVTPMIANSFFSHVFAYSLGNVHQTMSMNDLPGALKVLMNVVCNGCKIHFQAGLFKPPVLIARRKKRGLRINIYCWVRSYFTGYGRRSEIFTASTVTRARALPYVNKHTNRMHARTMIDEVLVRTHRRSGLLGKALGVILRDATSSINEFVPYHLNKPVDNALKNIFGPTGGIPLPYVCGIELMNSSVKHLNNIVIVDSDFRYNSGPLVRRFRHALAKKRP